MDNLTKEQRQKNMRNIRSKDTEIEIKLRKSLWKKGYRYRKNVHTLPGKPDIVLTKYKIVIFCDSEFFHGKDWNMLKLRLEKGTNLIGSFFFCPVLGIWERWSSYTIRELFNN